jgi:hypothetical protein
MKEKELVFEIPGLAQSRPVFQRTSLFQIAKKTYDTSLLAFATMNQSKRRTFF